MEKFKSVALSNLPNATHYAFMGERLKPLILSAGEAVQTALLPVMPAFEIALAVEYQWMEWTRKSALTAQIADADHRLDHALAAIKSQVVSSSYSIHPDVVESSYRLKVMLKNYGKVDKKSYEAEIGDVAAILGHLNGDCNADALKAGLGGWIPELQSAFNAFNVLFISRNDDRSQRPEGSFQQTRRNIDAVYYQIAVLAEAGTVSASAAQFAAFISRVNAEIDYLNAQYGTAKTDLSACQPEPIPAQQYTGSQITPTPKVFLNVKGQNVELIDGKDFYFEYKNNVKVGNAECIVRAKGGYKGTRTVTFVIHPAT